MSGAVLRLCGDCAVTVEFENEISIETNRKVIALKYRIEGEHVPGIRELVPSYRSLLIHYDPLKIPYLSLIHISMKICLRQPASADLEASKSRPMHLEVWKRRERQERCWRAGE